MRNLERISKAMTFDGVSASSTTSAKSAVIITNRLSDRPHCSAPFVLTLRPLRLKALNAKYIEYAKKT